LGMQGYTLFQEDKEQRLHMKDRYFQWMYMLHMEIRKLQKEIRNIVNVFDIPAQVEGVEIKEPGGHEE